MFKEKVTAFKTKVAVGATALIMALNNVAYADSLENTLNSNLQTIADRALTALATIIAISALITGAMSIFDMSQGQKSNNPEQQDKGSKTLVSSIGMAVAAAALLGIKGIINSFISAAISNS